MRRLFRHLALLPLGSFAGDTGQLDDSVLIDGPLQIEIRRRGLGVDEGQHLRQVHAAQAARWIDPVERVGEARPAEAAGAAAGWRLLFVDHLSLHLCVLTVNSKVARQLFIYLFLFIYLLITLVLFIYFFFYTTFLFILFIFHFICLYISFIL